MSPKQGYFFDISKKEIIGFDGKTSHVIAPIWGEECEGRVMASAMELYDALKALHDDVIEYQRKNRLGGENNHCLVQARAALWKATYG
jgi:hypothetical protein